MEHAEHVARLQHVLQQAAEKARKAGGRPACITATIFMEAEVPESPEARPAPPPRLAAAPGPRLPPRARAQLRTRCIGRWSARGYGHVAPFTGRRRRFWRGYLRLRGRCRSLWTRTRSLSPTYLSPPP